MDVRLLMDRAGGAQQHPDGLHQPQQTDPVAGRLVCCGDLDVDSSGGVLRDVEDLIALGYRDVHMELDKLRFCDVVGLGALLWIKDRLARVDGTLTLSEHTCQSLTLLLRTCRLSDQLEPLHARVPSQNG